MERVALTFPDHFGRTGGFRTWLTFPLDQKIIINREPFRFWLYQVRFRWAFKCQAFHLGTMRRPLRLARHEAPSCREDISQPTILSLFLHIRLNQDEAAEPARISFRNWWSGFKRVRVFLFPLFLMRFCICLVKAVQRIVSKRPGFMLHVISKIDFILFIYCTHNFFALSN